MNLNEQDIHGCVKQVKRVRKQRPSVTLIVERDVVSPVLFRNSDDSMAETAEFDGDIHARVNGNKFKSKERLTGLNLLRTLSKLFGDENEEVWSEWEFDGEIPAGLIGANYEYNRPAGLSESLNHDTYTYGVVDNTGGDFGMKSRVTEGYTYTLNPYDITDKEKRNAIQETGTMRDGYNEQTSSLFEVNNVEKDNKLLHFITIESATPAIVTYVIHNILNTNKYGAKTSSYGKNIENRVIGVITSYFDVSLSTSQYINEFGDYPDGLTEYIQRQKKGDWKIYSDELEDFEPYPDWFNEMLRLAQREDMEELYKLLRKDLETNLESTIDEIEL